MAKVLVASTDPVIASLLGTLLEVEQHRAIFPSSAEGIERAIERERPDLILLDCDHPELGRAGLIATARAAGTGIVLFSPGRADVEVRERAQESGVSWFSLPIDRMSLASVLTVALNARGEREVADST